MVKILKTQFDKNDKIHDKKLRVINQLANQKPVRGVSSETYQLVYLNNRYTKQRCIFELF